MAYSFARQFYYPGNPAPLDGLYVAIGPHGQPDSRLWLLVSGTPIPAGPAPFYKYVCVCGRDLLDCPEAFPDLLEKGDTCRITGLYLLFGNSLVPELRIFEAGDRFQGNRVYRVMVGHVTSIFMYGPSVAPVDKVPGVGREPATDRSTEVLDREESKDGIHARSAVV